MAGKLDEVLAQYQGKVEQPSARTEVHQAFDSSSRSYSRDKDRLRRLSQAPRSSLGNDLSDVAGEMAGIQVDLVALADEFGKLGVSFKDILDTRKSIYTRKEAIKVKYHTWRGNRPRVRQIAETAAKRKVSSMNVLADKMAQVAEEAYQKAQQRTAHSYDLQKQNVERTKRLHKELLGFYSESVASVGDVTKAEQELKKWESDLKSIDDALEEAQGQIHEARAAGDATKVSEYLGKMQQILQIQEGVLDGRLSAQEDTTGLRREMLANTKGLKSVRETLAAAQLNYHTITALIERFTDEEITYQNIRDYVMDQFREDARIAAAQLEAGEDHKKLIRLVDLSQRLLDVNARYSTAKAADAFEFLKQDFYNIQRAREVQTKVQADLDEQHERKKEWVEAMQNIRQTPQEPHYAKRS